MTKIEKSKVQNKVIMTQVVLLKNESVPKDGYREMFQQEGYDSSFIPLLLYDHYNRTNNIEFLQSEEFRRIKYIIISSQRAVECLFECMNDIVDKITRTSILEKVVYTVGPATALALTEGGFRTVKGGINAGNGEILSQIIINECSPQEEIVFFTGEIRKDVLPKNLKAADFTLKERILYKTEPRSNIDEHFKSWLQHAVNGDSKGCWVIFFSPQGTSSIIERVKKTCFGRTDLKVGTIGPTTSEYLNSNGIVPQVISPKPHPKSLVDAIKNWDLCNALSSATPK